MQWSEILADHRGEDPYTRAPEICVEVLSPSNSRREIEEKKTQYFLRGATEVWLCGADGTMSFYEADGPLDDSRMAPGFPSAITLD